MHLPENMLMPSKMNPRVLSGLGTTVNVEDGESVNGCIAESVIVAEKTVVAGVLLNTPNSGS